MRIEAGHKYIRTSGVNKGRLYTVTSVSLGMIYLEGNRPYYLDKETFEYWFRPHKKVIKLNWK